MPKSSKYADMMAAVPAAPPPDQKYQAKVDAEKASILEEMGLSADALTPEILAECYADARREADEIEVSRYANEVRLNALEQMISASWDREEDGWGAYGAGPNTVQLESGAAVDVSVVLDGRVEDADAFRKWCLTPDDICVVCGCDKDEIDHKSGVQMGHAFEPGGGLAHKLSLPYQTMSSIARDYAEEAQELQRAGKNAKLPPGLAVQHRVKVKYRKPPTRRAE